VDVPNGILFFYFIFFAGFTTIPVFATRRLRFIFWWVFGRVPQMRQMRRRRTRQKVC
jgi:hypothetical protein